MRIIVFGDSISEGMWDYEAGGWVNRLKLDYWNEYKYEKLVYNYGVSAYTTEHVLKIFKNSFDALCNRDASSEKEAVIIFAIGINDTATNFSTRENLVTQDKFSQNIQSLIDMCQKEKLIKNVIFISAINIDESKTNRDISRWGNNSYFNDTISEYNTLLENLALESTCGYIDIFGMMNQDDFEDGLHPNAQGHKKMYQKIKQCLEEKI
ncbi:GDSL-type esterase/lipase family protein [Candidatus Gracilibacteria bacterium]|nr:GDSL-type esterase/lipase family protein [Candidatus Gracilibacteria bacterium]